MADKKGAAKGKRSHSRTILHADDLRLNLKTRELTTGDNKVTLRPLECKLLETFMRNPDTLLTYGFLMQEVWDTNFDKDRRTLQVHVCWLRKKLGDDCRSPRYIHTERDRGYRFCP